MDYDTILLKIGEFGRWQKKAVCALLFSTFVVGFVSASTIFATKIPKSVSCFKDCETFGLQNGNNLNQTSKKATSLVSPRSNLDILLGKPDYCTSVNTCPGDNGLPAEERYECDENSEYFWDRDDFVMKSSVITVYNAYCMDGVNMYVMVCKTFQLIGMVFGCPFFGMVADTFGRRISITLAIFFTFVGSYVGPLAVNPWAYAVTRMIPGAGGIGAYWVALILAVEIIGKGEQVYGVPWNMTIFSFVICMFNVPMHVFGLLNALFVYIFRHWYSYQLVVACLCGISCFVWFAIPESPRWLIEKKKFEEAKDLLELAAATNKKDIKDDDLVTDHIIEEESEMETWSIVTNALHPTAFMCFKQGSRDVWSGKKGVFHPVLIRTTITLFLLWVFIAVIHFNGLKLIGSEVILIDSDYLQVGVFDIYDISSYVIIALLMDLVGRKPIITWCFLVTAICFFVSAAIHDTAIGDAANKVLVNIAMFHLAVCPIVVRIITTELYPTSLRATAVLSFKSATTLVILASVWLGEIYPTALTDSKYVKTLSLSLFGMLSLVSAILSLLLADTVGFPLPNNFGDVRNIQMFQKSFFQVARKNWKPSEK